MWFKLGRYVRIGIPGDSWFLGYQFIAGTPPDRNLVLCLVPPIAIAINLGALRHRLTCVACYPHRWRVNFWVR